MDALTPQPAPSTAAPTLPDIRRTTPTVRPADVRVVIESFDPGGSPQLVDRFVNLGHALQLQTSGRVPADGDTLRARLAEDFAFHGYGQARHFVAAIDGKDAGRCSAMLNRHARGRDGKRIGYVGHWECIEDDAPAHALLEMAIAWLYEQGAEHIVGPLDYSTWYGYRFTTGPHDEQPSLLEPYTPPHYLQQWKSFGFTVEKQYFSAECADLQVAIDRHDERTRAALAAGFRVRQLRMSEWDILLGNIWRMSRREFANQPHYTPVGLEEFRAMYAGARRIVDPRLVLTVHAPDGELAGFCFGLPDLGEAVQALTRTGGIRGKLAALRAKRRADTVLIKTLCVANKFQSDGVGSVLGSAVHRLAQDLGYTKSRHMLMHESNRSLQMSQHGGGEVCRRYVLLRLSTHDEVLTT